MKNSYVPGVLRLNDPLESIAIRNFPLQFLGKMYLTRRSIYLQNTADCYSVVSTASTGWCSAVQVGKNVKYA